MEPNECVSSRHASSSEGKTKHDDHTHTYLHAWRHRHKHTQSQFYIACGCSSSGLRAGSSGLQSISPVATQCLTSRAMVSLHPLQVFVFKPTCTILSAWYLGKMGHFKSFIALYTFSLARLECAFLCTP